MTLPDYNQRHRSSRGILHPKRLTARVLIVGLGAAGSIVVDRFARDSVGSQMPGGLTVVDGDVVAEHNIPRTHYRAEHVGISKAKATEQIIREIDSNIGVSYLHREIHTADAAGCRQLFIRPDLICLFADDIEAMLALGDVFSDVSQIMGFFHPGCASAELGFYVPGLTPPLRQTFGGRRRTRLDGAVALGVDTNYAANVFATVALQMINGDAFSEQAFFPLYPDAPLIAIGLRNDNWIFAHEPKDRPRSIYFVSAGNGGHQS